MTLQPDDRDGLPGDRDRRRLVLVRHAKAVSDSGGGDRGRPLTDRGRSDAASTGSWLAARAPAVDELWCSSAVRARQTADEIVSRVTVAGPVDLRDELYDAGPDDLLDQVRGADPASAVLVVVGHNPAMERLQAWLTGDDRGFPAGAAAVLEVAGDWAGLEPGEGRLADFFVP